VDSIVVKDATAIKYNIIPRPLEEKEEKGL
jgi:hypothetical protein